ncbi:hypothetical protein PV327_001573, partial [Microctonus hyperodae]
MFLGLTSNYVDVDQQLEFQHDWPRQCPQTLEHTYPIFLHPYFPPQPFVRLQKIVFSGSSDAGGTEEDCGNDRVQKFLGLDSYNNTPVLNYTYTYLVATPLQW